MLAEIGREPNEDAPGTWTELIAGVNVSALGPVSVVDGSGRREPLAGRPARILIELLVRRTGVERSDLADAIWPDGPPTTGASALRVHLTALRRSLAPAGISVERGPAGDRLEGAVSDIDVVDAILARARSVRGADPTMASLAEAADMVSAALGLWRGRPFTPFADDPTVQAAAESTARRRAEAEDLLVDLLLDRGAASEALRALDESAGDRTFDEGWWARRLLTLYRCGRQRDALGEYERVRRLLADELGLEPGPLLRDMHQRVLRQDPSLDWRRRTTSDPVGPELVGRAPERVRLLDGLRASRRGGPTVSVVTGEAGIGKTTLVRAFTDEVGDDATVLRGRAERTSTVPLRGILSAVDPYLGPTGGPAGIAAAEVVVPRGDLEAEPDVVAVQRHLVLTRLSELVTGLADRGTVVMVVDDAHWVDPMTVAFIDQLVRDHPSAPVHLVLTAREPDYDGSLLGELLDDLALVRPVDRIRLHPLEADEIDRIVGDDRQEGLHRASGGNPLFALQLQRLWKESGRDAPLPDGLLALCDARVRRLPASTRQALEGAAVIGLEFHVDDVAAVVSTTPAQVLAVLGDVVDQQLVETDEGRGRFRFVHGIVRRAVYQAIDPVRRTALHLAAARHLDGDEAQLPIRAAHLADARPLVGDEEVARAAGDAATRLLQVGAGEQAARFFRVALSTLSPSDRRRADAFLGLGIGLRLESDDIAAEEALRQAWADASAAGRWEVAADALIAEADFGPAATIPVALATVERLDQTLEGLDASDPGRRELLLTQKAHLLVNIDPAATALAIEEATGLSRGEPGLHLDHARLRLRESHGDDPTECARDAGSLSQRAEDEGQLRLAAEAAVHRQAAWLRAGDLSAFDADAPRCTRLASASGLELMGRIVDLMSVARTLAEGDVGAADDESERATADPPDGLGDLLITSRFMHLLTIRREQLRLRELEPVLLASLELNPRRLGRPLIAEARTEDGDPAGARHHLDVFLDELAGVGQDWVYLATLAFASDAALAEPHLALAEALRTRFDEVRSQVVVGCTGLIVGGHVDRHRGGLAAACGDLDDGIEILSEVRAAERARGADLWAGWAAHDEARARLRRRGPKDASVVAALMGEAAAVAERRRSARLAAAVERLRSISG